MTHNASRFRAGDAAFVAAVADIGAFADYVAGRISDDARDDARSGRACNVCFIHTIFDHTVRSCACNSGYFLAALQKFNLIYTACDPAVGRRGAKARGAFDVRCSLCRVPPCCGQVFQFRTV